MRDLAGPLRRNANDPGFFLKHLPPNELLDNGDWGVYVAAKVLTPDLFPNAIGDCPIQCQQSAIVLITLGIELACAEDRRPVARVSARARLSYDEPVGPAPA